MLILLHQLETGCHFIGPKFHVCLFIRQVIFSHPENLQNLDLSYKTDIDFWGCFGRVKTHLIIVAELHMIYSDVWDPEL